ncbi:MULTISPECIES: DnaD domain protein [Caloramator]|uniref:DnaD and phage-associated domain-containing protein n=1 Tax=Caloramator proteoclasticus DSM 10124 TaxID=1121262 RepID=A0A1M4U3D5_9CLOT|nr:MULTISPECIES: DnaD domain protein [Caloramator]SHE51175.1 DnaD and phage-associated domain-containing protein [Caloramator proteoclasticus DSM 10124]
MPNISLTPPEPKFIPLSTTFIDKYIPKAHGDYIKVYLTLLRLSYTNTVCSTESISKKLNISESEIINALGYWQENGLIHISDSGEVSFNTLNLDDDSCFVIIDNTKNIFKDIEMALGRPLTPSDYKFFTMLMDKFHFSFEVLIFLIEYCVSKKKTDIRYIEKVAIGWHEKGIKTIEDAQNHIRKHEEKWTKYRQILNYIGLKDSDISVPQEELLEKWIYSYNMPIDVILEACRIAIMRINEPNLNYIDKIVTDWYNLGVKNVNDIKRLDKKANKKEKASKSQHPYIAYSGQRQYDITELEKKLLGRGELNEE